MDAATNADGVADAAANAKTVNAASHADGMADTTADANRVANAAADANRVANDATDANRVADDAAPADEMANTTAPKEVTGHQRRTPHWCAPKLHAATGHAIYTRRCKMNARKFPIPLALTLGLLALGGALILLGAVGAGLPAVQAQGTNRYVSSVSGSDSGGCTDPANPCRTIQYAVDQATAGDEIRIATLDVSGSVTPPSIVTTTARYTGAGANVIALDKSLTLRGGYVYAHVSGLPEVWAPGLVPALVDGEGARRALHVSGAPSAGSGQAVTPTLELLAFVNGQADRGGNVYAEDTTLRLVATPIMSGTATYGGGLYLKNCQVSFDPGDLQWQNLLGISGLLLVRNNAAQYGGGLYLEGGTPVLAGLAVYANTATVDGGGLYLQGGQPTIATGVVLENQAGSRGGGLFLADSAARIAGMAVYSNTAPYGAGLYLDGPLAFSEEIIPIIANSYIRHNHTTGSQGGGLYLRQAVAGLVNNVVADNQAADGAGLYLWASSPQLFHNTIAQNSGNSGVYLAHKPGSIWPPVPPIPSYPTFTNTIVADHAVGVYVDSTGLPDPLQNKATLEGTLWSGNATDTAGPGTVVRSGDVTGDPRFTCTGDPPDCANPYHILADSAAVDAGVVVALTLPGTDLLVDIDGQPRPSGAGYDIGADEVVSETHSVWLIPFLSTQTAAPGQTVTHTHQLMNTGTETDTYDLTFSSDPGWATLLAATPVTLSPLTSVTVPVRVVVPDTATSGQWETSRITATSQADPGQQANAMDVTAVITGGQINLAVTKWADVDTLQPGDAVRYTLLLTITGGPLTEPVTVTLTDVMIPPQAIGTWNLSNGCTGDPATGLITCTRTLPAGTPSGTFSLTVVITSSEVYTGLLVNNVTVVPGGGLTDPDPTDNVSQFAVGIGGTWRVYLPLATKNHGP